MKILCVGDPHFKLELPYGDLIADGRRAERASALRTIQDAATDCDTVVMMGDNLDKRHNNSSVIKEFVEFLDGFGDKDIYIMSGNHETYEGNKTALDFLVGVKHNWHVITPTTGIFSKNGLGFVPYFTNASLHVSTTEEATELLMKMIESERLIIEGTKQYDAMFVHHMISDLNPNDTEIVLPRTRLEAVAHLVVAGHIHNYVIKGRTILTGNIFSHEVGDLSKSVLKIDTEDDTYSQVDLPIRPIYKVINPRMKDLDRLPGNAIVKVILTERGQDVEKIKEKLSTFDAHILVENYPDERTRLHVDEGQVLDLSIPALLDLYAKSKKKDPERLHKAFKIVTEGSFVETT